MHQGRLQIRTSLVAFASLDYSLSRIALTTTARSSRPSTAELLHAIVLDLERELLADELGVMALGEPQVPPQLRREQPLLESAREP